MLLGGILFPRFNHSESKKCSRNANVLVTGGTGFVSVNLSQRLLGLGANFTSTLHHKDPVLKDERIRYVRGDLRRQEDCATTVQGIDYVFMRAANRSGAAVMAKTPLGYPCTVKEVLSALLKIDNYGEAKVVFITSLPARITRSLIATTKAKSQLALQSRVSLEEGLRRTVAWYRGTLK